MLRPKFHQTAIALVPGPTDFSLQISPCFAGHRGYLRVMFWGRGEEKLHKNSGFPANN